MRTSSRYIVYEAVGKSRLGGVICYRGACSSDPAADSKIVFTKMAGYPGRQLQNRSRAATELHRAVSLSCSVVAGGGQGHLLFILVFLSWFFMCGNRWMSEMT